MFERLRNYFGKIKDRQINSLFNDCNRGKKFSVRLESILFDYAKTNIDETARNLLLDLLEDAKVSEKREAMFIGDKINETEDRAVLHIALRNKAENPIYLDGQNIMTKVIASLNSMKRFTADVRDGVFRGQGGKITDVVNIGIGGSDLGPAMAVKALAPYHDGPECHFISNIDGAHINDVLKSLNPKTTLVVVASKTFRTIETMSNAKTALRWMGKAVRNPTNQFVAISASTLETKAFGIKDDRVFGFDDWVGGRYSLWGPIGLSLMMAIGFKNFEEFLDGAHQLDRHFLTAAPLENLPVMLALTGIWHNQVCKYPSRAVLPYDQRLSRLPAYLQQLEMESNGKRVSLNGKLLSEPSSAIIWGEPGTNGQHAFYQLLHQGTQIVPCEFMVAAKGHEPELAYHHMLLLANCLAQSQALMSGRGLEAAREIAASKGFAGDMLEIQALHRTFPGNRPSTTLIYPKLTPNILGMLIALYEHRVFVEGVILNINSFDQWGVELGKELATDLVPILLSGEIPDNQDPSTQQLLSHIFFSNKG